MRTTFTAKHLHSLLAILLALSAAPLCKAAWFDSAWAYRRSIQITWNDDHAAGEELASCIFYTDGHSLPSGEDVRVATEDGKLVASHVLMAGPGDRIRVVFSLQKDVRNYAVYFGNLQPQAPPVGLDDVHYRAGVLLETRQWTGGGLNNFSDIERSWERSKPVLGKMMTDSVFMGFNAFGPQEQWISKFNASLFAPADGDYFFAMAVDDYGSLYIDKKPAIYATLGPGDVRFHATIHLDRGRHDFLAYNVNTGGPGYISIGWRWPGAQKTEIINRESFGTCYGGVVGPMEEHGKTLIADFAPQQTSECFFGDSYSFRYHFASKVKIAVPTKVQWDFGDGQTSDQPEVDHVYLVDGLYTVKLTARAGENSDTQTCKLAVDRNYAHLLDVRDEPAEKYSEIVRQYNVQNVPTDSLVRLVLLQLAADQLEALSVAAARLASMKQHADAPAALEALTATETKLLDAGRVDAAVAMWDHVPADADTQPTAARHAAELALWWSGDFAKAVSLLKPLQEHGDGQLHRLYGEAMLLSGNADKGREILERLNSAVPPNRRAALSGAAARSVEFFITEKDAEAGEAAWERWQARFPTDFLEGYSVLLRTKLMDLRKRTDAAAKLGEAFAAAQQQSPYAPQLLDAASKRLANTDPQKSQQLRQLLKQKYPEDPLSQD